MDAVIDYLGPGPSLLIWYNTESFDPNGYGEERISSFSPMNA